MPVEILADRLARYVCGLTFPDLSRDHVSRMKIYPSRRKVKSRVRRQCGRACGSRVQVKVQGLKSKDQNETRFQSSAA